MSVRRRHVLFIAGFDPKGAGYYHRLYRQGSAAQQDLGGTRYEVSPRRRLAGGNDGWDVHAAGGMHTTIEHLRWDDLVRQQWPRGVRGMLVPSLRLYAQVLRELAVVRAVAREVPRSVVALAYPLLYWVLPVLMSIVIAALAGWVAGPVAAAVGGALTLVGGAVAAWRMERRLHTTWLLRIYAFAARWADGRVPCMSQRVDEFAARIDAAMRQPDVDEVLLVGYSVGSMLAVAAAARWLDTARAQDGPPLGVLTLGQCIPLLALQPSAQEFRAQLHAVCTSERLHWVDISSPTDWGSFARLHPLALVDPAAAQEALNPRRMLSPRFHTLFDPVNYPAVRADKRRMHLQYLMPGERAGAYDWFDISAGPARLDARDWSGLAT